MTTLSDGTTKVLNNSIRNYDTTTEQNTGNIQYAATAGTPHTSVLANGAVNVALSGSVVSTPQSGNYDSAGIYGANTLGINGTPVNP